MIVLNFIRRKWWVFLPIVPILIGTVGYWFIEGWGFFESFYMSVITVSTVGYGEIHNLSVPGRAFTSFLIIGGVGSFGFLATYAIQQLFEATDFRERRSRRRARHMKNHFIICGAGRVGLRIVEELESRRLPFVVVDQSPETVDMLRVDGKTCVQGDATDEKVLTDAGAQTARGMACVMSTDAENVFTSLIARELNSELFIVARSNIESTNPKLLKAGANKVLNPFTSTASRIANILIKPTVVDFLEISSIDKSFDLAIEEIYIAEGSPIVGLTLGEAELRQRENVIAAGIQKSSKKMIFNPESNEKVEAGDVLIVIGSHESLELLTERIRPGT